MMENPFSDYVDDRKQHTSRPTIPRFSQCESTDNCRNQFPKSSRIFTRKPHINTFNEKHRDSSQPIGNDVHLDSKKCQSLIKSVHTNGIFNDSANGKPVDNIYACDYQQSCWNTQTHANGRDKYAKHVEQRNRSMSLWERSE